MSDGRFLSPFVTNTLTQIAQAEARMHYEYSRAMDKATSDEQKHAFGQRAIEHGQISRFFGAIAHARIVEHHQGPPDVSPV